MPNDDDLLDTTKDTAAALNVKPNTLEIWRHKRIGPPYIEISRGCIRYRRGDWREWVARRRRAPNPEAA